MDCEKELLEELKCRIIANKGLYFFLVERKKFEGWLKVELCNILYCKFDKIIPEYHIKKKEKSLIDLVGIKDNEKIAIELKVIPTNYSHEGLEKKTKAITNDVESILDDIKKLREEQEFTKKLILFIAYPISDNIKYWNSHLEKIKNKNVDLLVEEKIAYKGIPLIIYLFKVND
jgi:hypothetical protein